MTQYVEVPGIGPIGFPDGMSREQMAEALKKLPTEAAAMVRPTPVGAGFTAGLVRGARDVVDEGALMAAEAIEGLAPEGTGVHEWAQKQRQNVEAINRAAEQEYQGGWFGARPRPGETDTGRVVGNIAGTAAPLTRILKGVSAFRAGAAGGAAAGLTQPVGPTTSPSDYFAKKVEKTGATTALGGAGGVLFDKLGRVFFGAPRIVNPSAEAAVGDIAGTAAANIEAQITPTATVRGGGTALGRVGPDTPAGLTEGQAAALAQGKQLGMRVTPGQETGSRSLQQMEARMESNPFFSGPFNEIKIGNQKVLNRAAANAIGETADELSSPVLARASQRIGKTFDEVASPKIFPIDGENLMNGIASVSSYYDDVAGVAIAEQALVKQAISAAAKGAASGEQLRAISSKLGRAAKNQMASASGNRELGEALYGVKEYVDDALASTLTPQQLAAFNTARQQYRNLMTLESSGVVNSSSGNVSGLNLAGALARKDKQGFFYGGTQTPMYQAARFAQAFKPMVGDSGTATRSMELTPLNMMLAMPTNLAARSYATGTVGGMARAAAGGGAIGERLSPAARAAIQRALPVTGGVGINSLLD